MLNRTPPTQLAPPLLHTQAVACHALPVEAKGEADIFAHRFPHVIRIDAARNATAEAAASSLVYAEAAAADNLRVMETYHLLPGAFRSGPIAQAGTSAAGVRASDERRTMR